MTNSTNDEDEYYGLTKDEAQKASRAADHDIVLADLLARIEDAHHEAWNAGEDPEGLSITLNVQGLVVTGKVCSPQAWSEAVDRAFGDSSTGGTEPKHEKVAPWNRKYIHMSGARFAVGASFLPSAPEGTPWRGRLSHVSSWNYGELVFGGPESSED